MAIERTFSIIKPDATERNLTGAINAVIEKAGLRIVAQKRVLMSRREAETFYAVHKERPFFGELVDFMISGPVVVQVLEGENAVLRYREIMGATNPESAAEGTIRKLYAKSIGENSVHGSDSVENAKIEIAQFFAGNEFEDGRARPGHFLLGVPPSCPICPNSAPSIDAGLPPPQDQIRGGDPCPEFGIEASRMPALHDGRGQSEYPIARVSCGPPGPPERCSHLRRKHRIYPKSANPLLGPML